MTKVSEISFSRKILPKPVHPFPFSRKSSSSDLFHKIFASRKISGQVFAKLFAKKKDYFRNPAKIFGSTNIVTKMSRLIYTLMKIIVFFNLRKITYCFVLGYCGLQRKHPTRRFSNRNLSVPTKYRNFETNIPRKGISGHQPQFPQSCVYERFIRIFPRSVSLLCWRKYCM